MDIDEIIAEEMHSVINYLVIAQGINYNEMEAIESDDFKKSLTERLISDYEYFYEGFFEVEIKKITDNTYIIIIEAETHYKTSHIKDDTFIESILGSIEALTRQVLCKIYL